MVSWVQCWIGRPPGSHFHPDSKNSSPPCSNCLVLHHFRPSPPPHSMQQVFIHHCLFNLHCLIPRPLPPHSQTFTVSFPDLHCLIPRPSPPHSQTFTASFPDLHCLIPRPSLSHSQTFTASFPDLHCLIPRPSLPPLLPVCTGKPGHVQWCSVTADRHEEVLGCNDQSPVSA